MVGSSSRVLITGANGFIGKNLVVHLNEQSDFTPVSFVRGERLSKLRELLENVDSVIHLAGENRPEDERQFWQVNCELTKTICEYIENVYNSSGRHIPIIFASSIQAGNETAYGQSKLAGEEAIEALSRETGNPSVIFRLPGVFGKWCKPNYNSVVATFCHNIARGLPIVMHDPDAILSLAYVDDVVISFIETLENMKAGCNHIDVQPVYTASLSSLANIIKSIHNSRVSLISEQVGVGLKRALNATYTSYIPNDKFAYNLVQNADHRGVFVEMLKTQCSGQFSYFTAKPGITRGGHYHHTKTEKFLVVSGNALFRFRHLLTNQQVELRVCGSSSQVVDTIPGWSHDITNVGKDELIVMLWASENFNPNKPDTIASKV